MKTHHAYFRDASVVESSTGQLVRTVSHCAVIGCLNTYRGWLRIRNNAISSNVEAMLIGHNLAKLHIPFK